MKYGWKLLLICTLAFLLLATGASAADHLKGGAVMAEAIPMEIYGNYLVSTEGQEAEWFVFQSDADPAYYWANLTNHDINTTLYMTLYDKDGLKITEVDAAQGKNDYISWKAAPNETYYLRFVRYNKDRHGRFTLHLDKAPDIYANEMENAAELKLEEKILTSYDGSNDVDFFRFTAAEGSAYYRADFKNENINTTIYLTLYDKDGLKIAEADASQGQSDYLSWQITPGETYYLRFSRYDGYRGGQYTVTLHRYADAEPNTMEKGVELNLDTPVQAYFDGSNDVDFFRFTAAEGSAYYRADFKNENINTTIYLTLYDKDGLKIAEADASQGQSDYLSWQITPGETYYLRFSRYDGYRGGQYTVTLHRYADAEPNSAETVQEMPRNQVINASFDGSHDVDFFQFTTQDAHVNYLVNFKNEDINTTLYVEVLDENGLFVTRAEAGNGRTGWLNFYTSESKVYYLKCYRHDAYRGGRYTLEMKTYEDIETSGMETGPVLEDGKQGQFTLGAREDEDYFILPPAETIVYSYLTLQNFDTCGRITVNAYNAARQEIASWRVDNQKEHTQLLPQSQETIYLRVMGEFAGAYSLFRSDAPDIGGLSRETAMTASAAQDGELILEINNETDYIAFPCAGSALRLTCDPTTTVYVTMVDQNGQIIRNETRIRGNENALFTADRNQVYLQIKGNAGALRFACCTPDSHVASGFWQEMIHADCTQEGLRQMMCTVCGQVAQEEILPMLSHQAGAWQVIRPAGCDDSGLEALSCPDCGCMLEEKEIPAAGHRHSHWEIAAMPTCEGEGLQHQICDDCGKHLAQEIIPATGHIAGEWKEEKRPSCDSDGLKKRPCKLCGKALEEEILPALGHQPTDWLVQRRPNCELDGLQIKICQTCSEEVEQEILPATGHQASDWIIQQQPACESDGLQMIICKHCAKILKEEILPALSHEAGEWQTVIPPPPVNRMDCSAGYASTAARPFSQNTCPPSATPLENGWRCRRPPGMKRAWKKKHAPIAAMWKAAPSPSFP